MDNDQKTDAGAGPGPQAGDSNKRAVRNPDKPAPLPGASSTGSKSYKRPDAPAASPSTAGDTTEKKTD